MITSVYRTSVASNFQQLKKNYSLSVLWQHPITGFVTKNFAKFFIQVFYTNFEEPKNFVSTRIWTQDLQLMRVTSNFVKFFIRFSNSNFEKP